MDVGKVVVKIKRTNLFDLGARHRKLSKTKPRTLIPNPEHGDKQMGEEY